MRWDIVTPDQLRALADGAPTKYRSKRTYVAELDRWFASIHEAEVAITLWRRQQKGEVRDLRFQVAYRLAVPRQAWIGLTAPVTPVCTYVADFTYVEDGLPVVADAKGYRTPVYKLKKKLMKAVYGIDIVEL